MWRDKKTWTRIAAVGSAVWLGLMVIASQLVRDFRWGQGNYSSSGDPGPATIVAFAGVAIICAICFGILWISGVYDKRD